MSVYSVDNYSMTERVDPQYVDSQQTNDSRVLVYSPYSQLSEVLAA
jgi:hypothetical protein